LKGIFMNDDCCLPPQNSQSWIDLQHAKPVDILNLVADAYIGSTAGAFANSSNYGTPGSWATNSFTITSAPTCAALGTDDLAIVANAAQWNFSHSTANVASTNAIPLRKVIFLRAGRQWQMTIPVSLGGSTYTDIQLSFLDNAATRGDAQGTVPVIQWTGSFTGDVSLKVTLKEPGKYTMGLRAVTGGNTSMFEMEWIVVADKPKPVALGDLEVQSFLTSGGTPIDEDESRTLPFLWRVLKRLLKAEAIGSGDFTACSRQCSTPNCSEVQSTGRNVCC
jgi:hypothetical protein